MRGVGMLALGTYALISNYDKLEFNKHTDITIGLIAIIFIYGIFDFVKIAINLSPLTEFFKTGDLSNIIKVKYSCHKFNLFENLIVIIIALMLWVYYHMVQSQVISQANVLLIFVMMSAMANLVENLSDLILIYKSKWIGGGQLK